MPMHQLQQKDTQFHFKQFHKDSIFDINENLAEATNFSLWLPLSDQQLVKMCDASDDDAGYVLLIEDYANENTGSSKADEPFSSQFRRFTAGQMS